MGLDCNSKRILLSNAPSFTEEVKPPAKVVHRKSSESVPTAPKQSKQDERPTQAPVKRTISSSTAKVMQQKLAKAGAIDSSDDEIPRMPPQKQNNSDVKKALGGKAPPAVLKQHHSTGSKVSAGNKAKGGGGNASDSAQKKQKSIFSPENSSESDDDDDDEDGDDGRGPKSSKHKGGAKIKNVSKAVSKEDKTASSQKVGI